MATRKQQQPETTAAPPLRAMMTREQVLEMFPVSDTTLKRLIRSGGFPKPVRLSRRAFFYRDEVSTFFQNAMRPEPYVVGKRKTARRAKPGRRKNGR